jgi:hypothetical protein
MSGLDFSQHETVQLVFAPVRFFVVSLDFCGMADLGNSLIHLFYAQHRMPLCARVQEGARRTKTEAYPILKPKATP